MLWGTKWKIVPFSTALTRDVWKSVREVSQKFQITEHFQIMLFLPLIVLPLKYPCILSWGLILVLRKVFTFHMQDLTIGGESFYCLYTENQLTTDIHMMQYKKFNESTWIGAFTWLPKLSGGNSRYLSRNAKFFSVSFNFFNKVWALELLITTFSLHITQCCRTSLFIHLRSLPLFWYWGKGREETLIISLLSNFELIIWVFTVSLSNDGYASVIKPTIITYILFTTTHPQPCFIYVLVLYKLPSFIYYIKKLSLLIIAIYRDRFLCK